MTNPDNIVRVRARNGGRASVYEANGWCQSFTSGLLDGNGVIQNTSADMNVLVGGSASKPDVLIAENASGYKIALDVVGQQAVAVTAPASNSRISAIVAYTDDLSLATTEDTVTGSPASCGLIVVNGTASGSPIEPTDNQIRTAITADGATGSQAVYSVIATILVASNTTAITNTLITTNKAQITAQNLDYRTLGGDYSTSETSTGYLWTDGKMIYKKTIEFGKAPNSTTKSVAHNISSLGTVIKFEGFGYSSNSGKYVPIPWVPSSSDAMMDMSVTSTNLVMSTTSNRSAWDFTITLYYTKS